MGLDDNKFPQADCVRTAFVAIDAGRFVTEVSDESASTLKEFFEEIAPSAPDEARFLEAARTSNDATHWGLWLATCAQRRGGYVPLFVIGIKFYKKKNFPSRYTAQPWFWGWRMFKGQLAGAYSYVLRSLADSLQMAVAASFDPETWLTTTITLGPVPRYKFDPRDPIHLGTRDLTRLGTTVVMPAGNEAQFIKGDSLNPWALADWVICAGATTAAGDQLLPFSSRGIGASTRTPTVVAPGVGVTDCAALGHGVLMAIESAARGRTGEMTRWVADDGKEFGFIKNDEGRVLVSQLPNRDNLWVPVDRIPDFLPGGASNERGVPIDGTSVATEQVGAICRMIGQHMNSLGCSIERTLRPKITRLILEKMAEPMIAHERWEVGAGLVTESIATGYLQRLTKEDVAKLSEEAAGLW